MPSLHAFSSRCIAWYAGRERQRTHRRTRLPSARMHPHRSAAAVTRLAVVERVSASPCPPTHPFLCAGRSFYVFGDLLAGQRLPSAPQSARSASRARALVRAHTRRWCVSVRRSGLAVCGVGGARQRSWARSMRTRGARAVVCGTPGVVGVVTRAVPRRAIACVMQAGRRSADGRAWRVHSIVWGTAYPLVMRALPRGHVGECLRAWGRCHKHVWVPCASPNTDFGSFHSV